MRTHIDSILDVYRLNEKTSQKELILEDVIGKIEIKSQSIVNDIGKRTSSSSTIIYIPRKEFKEFEIQDIEDSILLIHRKKVNKIATNEWYQITAPSAFEGNNNTIKFQAERTVGFTDTNNNDSFTVL